MEKRYALGLDFGTLSGRALLVDIQTGRDVADCVYEYPHGVMDKSLPDGTALKADSALQDPRDYLEVLSRIVPGVIDKAGISPASVTKLGKNGHVTTEILLKICTALDCQIEDIMEIVPDDK